MKTALVTGATSGIGQAVAIALATAGYQVYAIGRSEAALNALRAAKSGIVPIALDLTDREAVEAALSDLQIDVLVNNADIMPPLGNFVRSGLECGVAKPFRKSTIAPSSRRCRNGSSRSTTRPGFLSSSRAPGRRLRRAGPAPSSWRSPKTC
ncbi:MAG: SDR family NAD(P)-dependent oxidoreductase [Hyphomicrobiales bacterium]|nr:SDR family NAD(P)-dependent oxidoreductase [Hyphomicrobiales bacterium]